MGCASTASHDAITTTPTTPQPNHTQGGSGSTRAPPAWATVSTQRVPTRAGNINSGASGDPAGDQPCGQAVEHHEPGHRHGHQVGHHADQWQPPEHQHTRKHHPDLRAEGDAERKSAADRASRQSVRQPRTGKVHTPAVAPTDSQNPIDHTSSGSIEHRSRSRRLRENPDRTCVHDRSGRRSPTDQPSRQHAGWMVRIASTPRTRRSAPDVVSPPQRGRV
jgi:hypothetical protein